MENELSNQSVLKTYYSKYLTDVRGLSKSSVAHYLDALNNISRRLKNKGLVSNDIYEIVDLEYLASVRSVLFSDPDFIELDERGRRMYSAGLNNYVRFASGEDFKIAISQVSRFDVPVAPSEAINTSNKVWKRSTILRAQVLVMANYMCEIDKNHQTFIAEKTNKAYMESHHLIPMKLQNDFDYSLDIYANIICLCPVCHRQIHYGLKKDRRNLIQMLYDKRAERLGNSGISISREEMIDLII